MIEITPEHIGWIVRVNDGASLARLEAYKGGVFADVTLYVENFGFKTTTTTKKASELSLLYLKPVNENCLFKEVIIVCEGEPGGRGILLGYDECRQDNKYLIGFHDSNISHCNDWFGVDTCIEYDGALRCPDVIYGDENE